MAADDLSTPLGQEPKKRPFALPVAVPRAVAGLRERLAATGRHEVRSIIRSVRAG